MQSSLADSAVSTIILDGSSGPFSLSSTLSIERDVAIRSPAGAVILALASESNPFRVVTISAAVMVSFANLTLRGGISDTMWGGSGGAMYIPDGASISMTNCTVRDRSEQR